MASWPTPAPRRSSSRSCRRPAWGVTMSELIGRLEREAANLKVSTSAERDGILQAVGAVAMVAGVVIAFVAYQLSLDRSDDRDIQSLVILAVSMLGLSVTGAAVFLRYSLARFLRFWLLRQLYEGQAHLVVLVAPLGPTTRSDEQEAAAQETTR